MFGYFMKTRKIIILFIILFSCSLFSWIKEGIYEAAYCGEIEKLKQYIQEGADLNRKDYDGDLPLSLAASFNRYEAVKLLLENGANVNGKSGYSRTALMQADSLNVLGLLIKYGASIELKDKLEGNNALLLAATKCSIKKTELLLKLGMDINGINQLNQTPLIKAISNEYANENKKLNFVKMLLDNKANLNLRDNDNKTAFIISKERGYNIISKLLLQYGATEENYKLDPKSLVNALMNKEYDRAKEMINNGIEVNFFLGDFSPLICSIENIDIMKLLLENGAEVNLRNKMNMTALTVAVISNKVNAVKLLLENNAEVNIVSTLNNQTPLMFALQNKNLPIIKMLKDKAADIYAKDSYGNTALLNAITLNSVNMKEVKFLIENSNQINIFNDLGMSPLFKAIGLGHIDLVQYLLKNGADVHLENYRGVTALVVARKTKNNPEMIKLLKDYGAKE
ncbi:MAG: hypothetical protein GQ534_04035 [Candidatus Delongbacteria bacterium]|nr:hypothetical protein [Candidatus Delongbacteria bacterium]